MPNSSAIETETDGAPTAMTNGILRPRPSGKISKLPRPLTATDGLDQGRSGPARNAWPLPCRLRVVSPDVLRAGSRGDRRHRRVGRVETSGLSKPRPGPFGAARESIRSFRGRARVRLSDWMTQATRTASRAVFPADAARGGHVEMTRETVRPEVHLGRRMTLRTLYPVSRPESVQVFDSLMSLFRPRFPP